MTERTTATSRTAPVRALRVLASALEEHCAALAACRQCGLDDPLALPIISEARMPRVMLVGQAPGKSETLDPRPFTGRAGRTLFRWLAQAGLGEARAREQIYIAAVTRCYPGPNAGGRGDRVPSRREQALCGEWLERELALIRPAILIPVGRLAVDRFLDPLPLEQLVGRAHTVRHVGGESTAIPLPHPSGASSWLFEPAHRELLNQALALLGEALVGVEVGQAAHVGVPPQSTINSSASVARQRARADRAKPLPIVSDASDDTDRRPRTRSRRVDRSPRSLA